MTGFGVADGLVSGGRLKVEIRTVNHRHFNPQLKMGSEFLKLEPDVKRWLRSKIERGNVAVGVRWIEEPARSSDVKADVDRARQIVRSAKELKDALELQGEVDLSFVARQPDVLSIVNSDDLKLDGMELGRVFDAAISGVVEMRSREGQALEEALTRVLVAIRQRLESVTARAPERLVLERARLKKSVAQLLEGAAVDGNRLEQEIAFITDKLDITEEMVRLGAHLEASKSAVEGDEACGRRLGFLAQEMLREINTIGSKANDTEIAGLVIEMKEDLEKFREQVENVE